MKSDRWEAVRNTLVGVGCHTRQLDGLRVHLPAPLRARLGSSLNEAWLISFWIEGQLRVIPKELWGEYLRRVGGELAQSISAKSVVALIAELAEDITFDRANRWLIPTVLANRADLGGDKKQVILIAREAWVEIWEAERWDQHAKPEFDLENAHYGSLEAIRGVDFA